MPIQKGFELKKRMSNKRRNSL